MLGLAACTSPEPPTRDNATTGPASPAGPTAINHMIAGYAAQYDVPADLVHRVVRRESSYNPAARNGPNLGLMQIQAPTARTMGFQGAAEQLFDADTNLRFGVKYLRGAWIVAQGDPDQAMRLYQRGYYYDAKRMGLLRETGLAR
ncbi:MAG: transglycosylase SLT domain-containing protein [Paracoccus sp. (in: a-proteobacteria)]